MLELWRSESPESRLSEATEMKSYSCHLGSGITSGVWMFMLVLASALCLSHLM